MAGRTNKQYNLDLYDWADSIGDYDMPMLYPESYIPSNIIPFNYALSHKREADGVHFFIDDYQFERCWREPQRYAKVLSKFECIFTPDFSLYMDMPKAMQIYNVYRSRLLGQYWQHQGLKVIPTVSWSDNASFEWCFDGLPSNATLAISTIGLGINKDAHEAFNTGVSAMIDQLSPQTILVYGRCDYPFDPSIKVKRYDNERLEFLHDLNRLSKLGGAQNGGAR